MTEHVTLGYIGLGNMGAPMAKRMIEWPGGVTVYDIRTEAMTPLAEAGASLADSIADVAAADLVHVTVLDDAQVRQVVGELAAHAKPGTVIAIHSTIGDTTAAEFTANHDVGMYEVSAAVTRGTLVTPGSVFMFALGPRQRITLSPNADGSEWHEIGRAHV